MSYVEENTKYVGEEVLYPGQNHFQYQLKDKFLKKIYFTLSASNTRVRIFAIESAIFFHICLGTKAQGHGMTFKVCNVGS